MDYEKKYNSALERARNYYKGLAPCRAKDELELIFPELSESEDERIRKALVWHLKADVDFVSNGVTKAECIAYLEKQKYDRMKPIYDARESFESALEKAWNDYHNGYENVDKLEDDYVECAHAKGFREGYLFGIEKQKEQKPVENPFDANETMKMKDRIDEGFTKMIMQEQKPVDYDAELKKCKDNPLYFYDKYVKIKLKPSEWSEEDETMINHIIEALPKWANGLITILPSQAEEYVKRLKSLRPSWKPSEEQMMALRAVAKNLPVEMPERHRLEELYEQLKKL